MKWNQCWFCGWSGMDPRDRPMCVGCEEKIRRLMAHTSARADGRLTLAGVTLQAQEGDEAVVRLQPASGWPHAFYHEGDGKCAVCGGLRTGPHSLICVTCEGVIRSLKTMSDVALEFLRRIDGHTLELLSLVEPEILRSLVKDQLKEMDG